MAALSASRRSAKRTATILSVPLKATSQIYQGGMVALLAGVAIAARAAVSRTEQNAMVIAGVARADALGGASDGLVKGELEKGVMLFANSAGVDAIALADVNSTVFAVDDQTVAKTVGAGLRLIAGRVVDVSTDGVWVDVGDHAPTRRMYLTVNIDDLRGAQAQVYRLTAPRGGAITKVSSRLLGALTTGDALVTGKIGATAMTNGALNLVQAGSAAGNAATVEPTAANVVVEGDEISFTVSGAQATQTGARLVVELTY